MSVVHAIRFRDRLVVTAAWCCAGVVGAAFGWILFEVARHGWQGISFSFVFEAPRDSGRQGGIAPILVSTAMILTTATATAVPLGFGAAVFLVETGAGRRLGGLWLRRSLDVLAATPSIVVGLFGNVFFCVYLGMGFSILAGALTLACMVLPLLIRTCEQGLRAAPIELRQGAAALGLSRSATLWHVIVPAAFPSLLAAAAISFGRAAAETAALIFTSGYVDRMPRSVWDSGRALSVHIYDLSMNVPGGDQNAYASALTLIGLVLGVNVLAQGLARRVTRT